MINGLVDSPRVRAFNHPKKIVCVYQSANLAHFGRIIGKPRKIAVVTIPELCIREIHNEDLLISSSS